jgi:hypothetical protein
VTGFAMWARIGRAAVFFVALLLSAPAGASADQGCHNRTTETTYVFSVRGSHGYRIDVESFRSGKVRLTAEKEHYFAEYTVRGRSDEQRLEADFGQLGGISVQPRHRSAVRYQAEPVRLTGRIQFHGEEGFTSISLRGTRGAMSRKVKRSCPPSGGARGRASTAGKPSGRPAKRAITFVAAAERTANRSVLLSLQSSQPPLIEEDGGGDFLVVFLEERREGMAIRRAVTFDESVATASATPPGANPFTASVAAAAPFSGTASYSQAAGAPATWAGDLAVSLPGVSNLPLAGPGFSAVACVDTEKTNRRETCEGEIEDLIEASLLFPLSL